METSKKTKTKTKSIDLQTKTCIHTHSVKFRKSEHAPNQTILKHISLKSGIPLTPNSAKGIVRAHWR